MLGHIGNVIQHAPTVNATIKGLGAILETQPSLVRFLAKNWPISLLAGAALGSRLWSRYKKKDLTAFDAMADIGMILGPVVALFTLQQMAQVATPPAAMPPPHPMMTPQG